MSDLVEIHIYQRKESCTINMTGQNLLEACSSMDVMRVKPFGSDTHHALTIIKVEQRVAGQ